MDANRTAWDAAKLRTEGSAAYAPQPVLMAMLSLMNPDDVAEWVAQDHEVDNETQWHVTWLSTDAIVTCTAHKACPQWGFDSPEGKQDPDSMDVSLFPLRHVSRVEVNTLHRQGLGVRASWDIGATVHLSTGDAIRIPAVRAGRYVQTRAEALIKELVDRIQ